MNATQNAQNATQIAKTFPAKAGPRMTLADVRKGRFQAPLRVLLYGVEGCGKSTFASGSPKPIFLGAESGTGHLDIARLPEPQSWGDVLEGVRLLGRESHEYQTLVLDPVNWLQPLVYRHVCESNKWRDIEEPGYGKGYTAAIDHWRELIVELERLWTGKRMHILLVAHSLVKLFKNPEGEDFERYQVDMHDKAAAILKQWCDVVLFAKHEAFAKKDTKTRRVRGASTGARVMYTAWSAAYDAKNRHGLPEELPLSWAEFDRAIKAGAEQASEIRARIEAMLVEIADASVTAKARGYIADAGENVGQLAEIENAAAIKLDAVRTERQSTAT